MSKESSEAEKSAEAKKREKEKAGSAEQRDPFRNRSEGVEEHGTGPNETTNKA